MIENTTASLNNDTKISDLEPKMKLLIAGGKLKISELEEFGKSLTQLGIENKVVIDEEVYDTFPSPNVRNWFKSKAKFCKLIKTFAPDVVLVDRISHFALAAKDAKIPIILFLRGDIWSELKLMKSTRYKSLVKRVMLWQYTKMFEECFENSNLVLSVSKYLKKIIAAHAPNKNIEVLHVGINQANWYPVKGMDLKHPCVGLLQDANIWGKIEEMLVLKKVLGSMPNVTFYWAGDGPYKDHILSALMKFQNFQWLGRLEHPNEVRQYLTEIDVYALISGMDSFGVSNLEAQLMEKPIVATNVGGIPETMKNNETGYLVEKGDHNGWIEKLSALLDDKKKAKQIGVSGRNFVIGNFSWNSVAKQFIDTLNFYFKPNQGNNDS